MQTWNSAGPSDAWDTATAGNWTPGPFANGDSAIFGGVAETVDVAGSVSVAGLTFNTTGYTLAGSGNDGTLTLTAAITIAEAITAGSFTITRGTGLTGTANLVLSGANSIAGTITINTATGSSTNLTLGANNGTTAATIIARRAWAAPPRNSS